MTDGETGRKWFSGFLCATCVGLFIGALYAAYSQHDIQGVLAFGFFTIIAGALSVIMGIYDR